MGEPWVTGGLLAIMVLVLTLPFFSHRVEKQLEICSSSHGHSMP